MTRLRRTALLSLVLLSVSVAGLKETTKGSPDDIPSEYRFNFFDAELVQAVASAQSGNILVSPVSVKAVLAMILEGAGGDSADQIRTALRLPEKQEAIQRVFNMFLKSLMEKSSDVILEMASRVFMAKHLSPNPGYSSILRNYYFTDLVKVDFNTPSITARNINDWVKQVTRGLIPKLIDSGNLAPDAQAIFANAIYFKGRWKIPFDPELTSAKCFYTSPNVCHNTNMMETLEYFNYNYIRELDADALELPYHGDKFSMLLLAPREVDGMVQLKRDILHVPLHRIIRSLETVEVRVSLPRFEIEYATDLVPTLYSLGIKDIFGPRSNLTGLFARGEISAQVSNVFHKSKIIVNEAGSEAGAGTGALVIPLMGSTIAKFRADRPFLFFIRDTTSGITLFAGRVSVPESASPQYQRPQTTTSTLSPSDVENLQQSVFTDKYVSTLRPSNSNLASGQGYRPITTTTRKPIRERPPLHHGQSQGSQAAQTTSTTEGRDINSYINQNPPQQTSQNTNVHYPVSSQGNSPPYRPPPQQSNSQNSFSSQNEPQVQPLSLSPSSSSSNNNRNTYNSQSHTPQQSSSHNSNAQYSPSSNPQYNSQSSNTQQVQTASRPASNNPSTLPIHYPGPSESQSNTQNLSPQAQYPVFNQNTNTQYQSGSQYQPQSQGQEQLNSNTQQYNNQNRDGQTVPIRDNSNNQFTNNNQNSGAKYTPNSPNSFPSKIGMREMPQYLGLNQMVNVPYIALAPPPPPPFLQYIPGNSNDFFMNKRESLQASNQQSQTYSSVSRNEAPISKPVYQLPQSQDKDAILFQSQPAL